MPGKAYVGSALLRLSEMLAFSRGMKRLNMEILHEQLRFSPRKADYAFWRISRFSPISLTVFHVPSVIISAMLLSQLSDLLRSANHNVAFWILALFGVFYALYRVCSEGSLEAQRS